MILGDISRGNITRREGISFGASECVPINHPYSSLGTRRLLCRGPPSIPELASGTPLSQPPVGEYFDVLYSGQSHCS